MIGIVIPAHNEATHIADCDCAAVAAGRHPDADTIVSEDWLVNQLALQMDAVCGTVQVDDWSEHTHNAPLIKAHFAQTYHDRDGHSHIHGANLGVSAVAYRKAGGFEPLACSKDVNVVEALRDSTARNAWSAVPRVTTSARTHARARGLR